MSKKNDTNSIVLDRDISQPEGRLKRKKPPLRKKKIDEDIKSGEGKQKGNENLEDNSRNKNINNNVNNTNDNCQKHNSQEDNQNKSNISQESEQDNVREFEDNENETNHNEIIENEKVKEDKDNEFENEKIDDNLNSNTKISSNVSKKNTKTLQNLKCYTCEEFQFQINQLKDHELELQSQIDKSNTICQELNVEIGKLQKDLELRNKNIKLLTETNYKQKNALENLSNQLDQKIERLRLMQATKKKNETDEEKQKKEIEKKLSLKEQELKNSLALIQILSRDNKKLKELLDTYGEYKKKMQLVDLSHFKDDEKNSLMNEINLLKKEIAEHKLCNKKLTELNTNIKYLKSDVKLLKAENTELKKKINMLSKPNPLLLSNSQSLQNIKQKSLTNRTKSVDCKNKRVIHKIYNKNNKSQKSSSIGFNKSKEIKNIDNYQKLFTEKEKYIIEKLYENDQENYEKFIRKISILEGARLSLLSKHKIEIKILSEKIENLNEQIEYLNLKNKESESRLKIFQYQVNEYKNGTKIYQKRINEMQSNIEDLTNQKKEKQQEASILSHKIQELQEEMKNIKQGEQKEEDQEEQEQSQEQQFEQDEE